MHFFSHRRNHHGSAPESPKGRALRMVLLICVFAAVLWGFWHNSQRRFEDMGRQNLLRDETGELTKADKEALFARARVFQSTHGLSLKVHVHTGSSGVREASPRDIFLDISPARREVILTLPPMARRALGMDFVREVEDAFAPYFAQGAWKKALPAALDLLQTKMNEVSR